MLLKKLPKVDGRILKVLFVSEQSELYWRFLRSCHINAF